MNLDREAIFREIQAIMQEQLGSRKLVELDDRIDFAIKRHWDGMDLVEFLLDIGDRFGIDITEAEWSAFCGSKLTPEEWEAFASRTFTFSALVDLIVTQLERIKIEPVSILGRPCATAGAFRAIEAVATQLCPELPRFRPSDALPRTLRGRRLDRFWNRLRWLTQRRLVPLRETTRSRLARLASLVCIASSIMLGCFTFAAFRYGLNDRPIQGLASHLFLGAWTLWVLGAFGGALLWRFLTWHDDRMPTGISTFKDLAVALVKCNDAPSALTRELRLDAECGQQKE